MPSIIYISPKIGMYWFPDIFQIFLYFFCYFKIDIQITTSVNITISITIATVIATTIAKLIFAIKSYFFVIVIKYLLFYDSYNNDYILTINIAISIARTIYIAMATDIAISRSIAKTIDNPIFSIKSFFS